MRQGAEIKDLAWQADERKLRFTLSSVGAAENKLTVMLPKEHAGGELVGIEIDETEAALHTQQVGSVAYSCAQAGAGTHTVVAYYNA